MSDFTNETEYHELTELNYAKLYRCRRSIYHRKTPLEVRQSLAKIHARNQAGLNQQKQVIYS
jgi:hypothetical protein